MSATGSTADFLAAKTYPGRGIVQGLSPNGRFAIQVYWLMGRSTNSRNRVFVVEGDAIKTQAFDPSLLSDPSLIIYYAARVLDGAHILSNGDHTDTIRDAMAAGKSFEDAVYQRTFEPDGPNYTPRIAALVDTRSAAGRYKLSIVKSDGNDPARRTASIYTYDNPRPGFGYFISTYEDDGVPLPSFAGDPRVVQTYDEPRRTLETYWNLLNRENRIAILTKYVDLATGGAETFVLNGHETG